MYDHIGGSTGLMFQPGLLTLFNAALTSTNGWPWQVFNQPSSPVLTNLAGFNGQTAGKAITNLQVIQYATVQLTNAGASKFVSTLAGNGNTNLILILNTNYTSTATATNIAQNATLIGGGWLFNLDANNTVWLTNSLSGATPTYGFQTNGLLVIGQSGGATLRLGMYTNNTPAGSYGNGSFLSTTNGQYYGVSNSAVFQIYMP